MPGLATTDAYRLKQAIALTKTRRAFPNIVVFSIIVCAYTCGLLALFSDATTTAVTAVALLWLAMTFSWYLSHDCAHGVVTGHRRHDQLLGELLSWINGYTYFSFSEYMADHLRHHAKQVDIVGIEMGDFLARLPGWLRNMVFVFEYCHIPFSHSLLRTWQRVDILCHGPRRDRVRVIMVLIARSTLLGTMGFISLQALMLYVLAVILRIHCVRFVDAFQHTYPEEIPARIGKPRGKDFEQTHTFSFPLARRHPGLNLLILNFGYHNAHHALPTCPWYHLPRLHQLLYEGLPGMEPPAFTPPKAGIIDLLKAYHRHRMRRMTGTTQGRAYDDNGQFTFAEFYGAYTDKLLG